MAMLNNQRVYIYIMIMTIWISFDHDIVNGNATDHITMDHTDYQQQ